MEYNIILLFITAILNAIFSFLMLGGSKNIIKILFSLIALAVSFWAISLAFFLKTSDSHSALLLANLYYIFAASIPLLFFYFSLVFLKINLKIKKVFYLFTTPFVLLIFTLLLNKHFLIQSIFIDNFSKNVQLNSIGYLLYSLYFIIFVFISYVNLFQTYKKEYTAIGKKQLMSVIYGTLLSYIPGIVFNLILPWFGNYGFIWLGPVFSIIMVISIGYAIIKHHLFNIKIIATELFIFAVWIAILMEVFAAETVASMLFELGVLAIVVVFGILIIRSVTKEIKTREKIEKLASSLEKANVRLRELDKQKSEFVSIASHQLRSPLTSIKGYASMLLDGSFGKIDDGIRIPVDKIMESSKRLVNIVEDFLDVTRIEQGRMQYDLADINLKDLLVDIINNNSLTIKSSKLKVNLTTDKGLAYIISADESKIRQVFINLLDNAIKYTSKGSVDIKISENIPNKKILISVKDSGIGIPADFINNKLFGKFNRSDNARNMHANGSGIGLYVASEIVKSHKGKLWVKSDGENKGTSFFVELPAV